MSLRLIQEACSWLGFFPSVVAYTCLRQLFTSSPFEKQALGQCSTYLSTHLPSAKRIPVASTALAATLLSNSQSSPSQYPTHLSQNVLSAKNNVPPVHEDGVVNGDLSTKPLDGVGAAICSKEIVMELEGLEIVEEGVQNVKGQCAFRFLENGDRSDVVSVFRDRSTDSKHPFAILFSDNYTRFILLSRPTPDPNPSLLTPTSTSQPSSTPPSSFFILDDPSHIDSIPKSNTVKSIISRPFPKQGQKYAKRYLVEIEGSAGEDVGTDDASEGFGRRPGVMYLGSV